MNSNTFLTALLLLVFVFCIAAEVGSKTLDRRSIALGSPSRMSLMRGEGNGGGPPNPRGAWSPPQLVTDNSDWNNICTYNPYCDYQNPDDCSTYIGCGGLDYDYANNRWYNQVFLFHCVDGLNYDPICDCCVYPGPEECPWPSIWEAEPQLGCGIIGQINAYQTVTLPLDSYYCGKGIRKCTNGTEEISECPGDTVYNRLYLACMPKERCHVLDGVSGWSSN